MTTPSDPRQELDAVEADIARLRSEIDELTTQSGDADESREPEETAALLNNVEENQAVLSGLEARRDALRKQLG